MIVFKEDKKTLRLLGGIKAMAKYEPAEVIRHSTGSGVRTIVVAWEVPDDDICPYGYLVMSRAVAEFRRLESKHKKARRIGPDSVVSVCEHNLIVYIGNDCGDNTKSIMLQTARISDCTWNCVTIESTICPDRYGDYANIKIYKGDKWDDIMRKCVIESNHMGYIGTVTGLYPWDNTTQQEV